MRRRLVIGSAVATTAAAVLVPVGRLLLAAVRTCFPRIGMTLSSAQVGVGMWEYGTSTAVTRVRVLARPAMAAT
jgi:hypothetical protein